jgi:hypothetical protein
MKGGKFLFSVALADFRQTQTQQLFHYLPRMLAQEWRRPRHARRRF